MSDISRPLPGKPVTVLYLLRLAKIRNSLRRRNVDGFLVTDINNIRYLTGFSGSSGFLLVSERENIFVTDPRYKEQAEGEVSSWDIMIEKRDMIKTIKKLTRKAGMKKVGIESSVSYDFFRKLSRDIPLISLRSPIEKLRSVKDSVEVRLIKEAVKRAEAAFLEVRPYIRKGLKEITIAMRLEESLKKKGCRHLPFDVIVASGPNSAKPHARPTERKLDKGDLVVVDFGGEAEGYFSDMTRTLLIDRGDDLNKKKQIYQLVLEANKSATLQISPGIESRKIDSAARKVIKKAGYGKFFGHGTGHGIGLQVHELPHIAWGKREIIKEHMVFTIEPGIYLSGLGGVRIEDMVMVKRDGSEVLTTLPKKLEIIK